jgi:hypothetical protein
MFYLKKLLAIVVTVCFLLILSVPSFSEDRPIDPKRDLKGISPKRHRYIFSVLGGAALGAGLGAILGSGNDLTKGALVGGGAMSSFYLSSHRNAGNGYRDWAYIFSHTALGTGIGWTACGCDDGAVAGALIGGGGTAAWRAMNPESRRRTATTAPQP